MAAPRFFVATPLGATDVGHEIELPSPVAHHAMRVLRLDIGEEITLFTGAGGQFAAKLSRADKRGAHATIERFDPVEREASLEVTLAQAIAANDAMDYAVRKAVELGVAAIQPLVSARSARFADAARGDKRLAHWRQVAVAACEQCGRNRVPVVHEAIAFSAWLAQRGAGRPGLLLAPQAPMTLAQWPAPTAPFDLLIGPEGGFAETEVAAAVRDGIEAVRLGPRILRTETAAAAALAAIHALWGDFR